MSSIRKNSPEHPSDTPPLVDYRPWRINFRIGTPS
jgi:hypothetical protein